MPIRSVVFDAYDTLFDNGRDFWLESFQEICSVQGIQVDPETLWRSWISLERKFRQRRINLLTMERTFPFERYREVWTNCFAEVFSEYSITGNPEAAVSICIRDLGRRPAFPETLSILDRLSKAYGLAILSNSDSSFLYPLLRYHQVLDRFSAVVTSEEAQAYKPHPLMFQTILDHLKAWPEETVQVGDAQVDDILGGSSIGMKTIWVNRRGETLDPGLCSPDYQIRELSDLVTILEGIV